MRRTVPLENSVVKAIVNRLRDIPGVLIRKRHGTAMGVGGDPDLYGTLAGQHFEIEVKRPFDSSSDLTELQFQRLREWKKAGAIVGVARSVGDALAILGYDTMGHNLVELAPFAHGRDSCEELAQAYQRHWSRASQ